MSNVDGRLTGLIYPNEEIEIYMGSDQSIKIFKGLADTITTDPDGLHFKAFDNLALLKQEFITEEYQAEWRDTDVGAVIRAIVGDSQWALTGKFIRTDTGISIGRLNFRWKSRLEALQRCVELANSGPNKYVMYCDGNGDIIFRRYDDDEFVMAHMTTETEMDHTVEDLNDVYTRALYFFLETEDVGGTETLLDESMFENDMEITGTTISGRHRTKGFSHKFAGSQYGEVLTDPSLDVFSGETFTVDIQFYVTSVATSPAWNILMIQSGSNVFSIYIRDDDTRIQIRTDQPGTWSWEPAIGWSPNEWNYLTLVVSGDDVYLYKNGVLADSTTQVTYGWVGSGSDGFYVGDDGVAPGAWPFIGYIDLVRLSSKALSPSEIYNYTKIQSSDIILEKISKIEMGGEQYNHCVVKYSDTVWAQYPDPIPTSPITKFISTTSEQTEHDCYIRAKAIVQTHRRVPTQLTANGYSARCDYRPNDLVEVYSPRYNIVGKFRLKNLTYTVRDNVRKISMTLDEEQRELTKLLAIGGL